MKASRCVALCSIALGNRNGKARKAGPYRTIDHRSDDFLFFFLCLPPFFNIGIFDIP